MHEMTRRGFAAVPAAAAVGWAEGEVPKRMITGRALPALIARADWRPYARLRERAFWAGLPAEVRSGLVKAAEAELGKDWPSLPAHVALDYARNGNRSRYEAISFGRRTRVRQAALAECVEGKGRFLDEVLDGLWLICEESFWGVSAHVAAQKAGVGLPDVEEPIVDLFAAETANLVAWVDYLMPEALEGLSKLLRPRLRYEVQRRVLKPCFERTDFWWMGKDVEPDRKLNNWTPWICSNWLAAALLMEEDEGRRAASVEKALRPVDRFLADYPSDGGCDEGPSYWGRAGASLFDCLELLYSATGGKANSYGEPLVKEIGAYTYRAHIAGPWYTNFADAPAQVRPNATLVYRYGQRIGDAQMMAHGAWLAASAAGLGTKPEAMGRGLDELAHLAELKKASAGARPPMLRDVLLPGIQVAVAREKGGTEKGFYFAAQGGHNAESHNHNDVGNFLVFYDGAPVLIDVGVEMYTAKTFSSQRYTIWTMQSAWHNCPTLNGVMQRSGRQFAAREFQVKQDDRAAEVSLDLAGAYPEEAGIQSYRRRLRLDRAAGRVELEDLYRFTKGGRVELNLITSRQPVVRGDGGVELAGGFRMTFGQRLKATIDEHETNDARLRPSWGERVWRVRLEPAEALEGKIAMRLERVTA